MQATKNHFNGTVEVIFILVVFQLFGKSGKDLGYLYHLRADLLASAAADARGRTLLFRLFFDRL